MADIQLGEKIKAIREEAGLGLRDLASKANVSPSMLSQIENGSANPFINTLKNIAVVLNAPLYRFFQESTSPEALVVHKDSRKIIGFVDREVQYELLTPDVSGQIEFCLMTIPPTRRRRACRRATVQETEKAWEAQPLLRLFCACRAPNHRFFPPRSAGPDTQPPGQ